MTTPAIRDVAESTRSQVIALLSLDAITAESFRAAQTIIGNFLGFLDTIHTYGRRQEVLEYEAYKAEKARLVESVPQPEPVSVVDKELPPKTTKAKRMESIGESA